MSTPSTVASWPTQPGAPAATTMEEAGFTTVLRCPPARRDACEPPVTGQGHVGHVRQAHGHAGDTGGQRRLEAVCSAHVEPAASRAARPSPSASSSRAASSRLTAMYGCGARAATPGVCMLRSSEPKMWCSGTSTKSSSRARKAGGADGAGAGLRPAGRVEQARAHGPAAKRPVDLLLQLVQAVPRVPASGPDARQQGRGRLARGQAFERVGERRVRVGGRRRLEDRDAGVRCRAAAEALWLARHLAAGAAPVGRGRRRGRRRGTAAGPSRAPRARRRRRASRAPPGDRAAPSDRASQRHSSCVSPSGDEHAEGALRAALVVDEGAGGLSEGRRGQHDVGARGDAVLRARRARRGARRGRTGRRRAARRARRCRSLSRTHDGVGLAARDGGDGVARRAAAHHAQPHAVRLGHREDEGRRRRPRPARRPRQQHGRGAVRRAADDQRAPAGAERVGPAHDAGACSAASGRRLRSPPRPARGPSPGRAGRCRRAPHATPRRPPRRAWSRAASRSTAGSGARRLARPMAASFQRRMCTRSSSAVGRSRSHVRTVRSSIGAVLVRSSPRMNTASACWTSARVPRGMPLAPAISSTVPDEVVVRVRHAEVEALGADQRAKGVVGLERRPRRADADHAAVAQERRGRVECPLPSQRDGSPPPCPCSTRPGARRPVRRGSVAAR